jgi:hypothetical protein
MTIQQQEEEGKCTLTPHRKAAVVPTPSTTTEDRGLQQGRLQQKKSRGPQQGDSNRKSRGSQQGDSNRKSRRP